MNKNFSFISIAFLFLFLTENFSAQIVNIPDANFKTALLNHNQVINTNGDSEIQLSEAQSFASYLEVSYLNISDLTGIEAFIKITKLYCHNNQLTSLNIADNKALTVLECYENQLTTLNLTSNTFLTILKCYKNKLPTLDLTANKLLTHLDCYENQLTTLDLKVNMALQYVACYDNQLTFLDLLNHKDLKTLYCPRNKLTSLNISGNINLANLSCYGNQLTSLNLKDNISLDYLDCSGNQLTSLNLQTNNLINILYCGGNQLSFLDMRNNFKVVRYDVQQNPDLTCISVSNPTWSKNNWINMVSSVVLPEFSNNCSCGVFSIDIDSVKNVSCSDLGYARASVSGGIGPVQYKWLSAPLSLDSILIADTAGIYFLKVTDTNQCESFTKLMLFGPKVKTSFDLNTYLNTPTFRPGRLTTLNLVAQNNGCLMQKGELKLVYNGSLNFESALIPPTSQNGNTLVWNLENMAYAANNFFSTLQFKMDTLAQLGDKVCFELLITPFVGDADSLNNKKFYCFEVVNSYDPNDKQVYPQGICAENYTLKNQPLTYTIRFQNTGNAPAIDIHLTDVLSPYLNMKSLRVLSTSHEPMITELIGDRTVKFNFANINLADSLNNQEGSKGYVTYQINPYVGLDEGTLIENKAGIYFDFNAPVITNTTYNTMVSTLPVIETTTIYHTLTSNYTFAGQSFNESGIYKLYFQSQAGCDSVVFLHLNSNVPPDALVLYPNPTDGQFYIDMKEYYESVNLKVTDLQGREISNENVNNKELISLSLNGPTGIYFVSVKVDHWEEKIIKLIKN